MPKTPTQKRIAQDHEKVTEKAQSFFDATKVVVSNTPEYRRYSVLATLKNGSVYSCIADLTQRPGWVSFCDVPDAMTKDSQGVVVQWLRQHFPWLDTDDSVSGADVVERLAELYQELTDKALKG